MKEKLRIVVTGEVDSGKSTLIGRFLFESKTVSDKDIQDINYISRRLGSGFEFAYLLDSLEEERKGQLTIETTQAFCRIKKGKQFVFIDVPGHQELLKNMLSGSSYGDIALLVIDVQKSIEEQTKRHTFILKFLGIRNIILVLNKMDLVNFNERIFNKITKETAKFLKAIEIKPEYFIPISAKQGDNLIKKSKRMTWYKGLSLIKILNTFSKTESSSNFRFPIQDVYNIDGEEILAGKIISGEIRKGESVKVLSVNKNYRIKKIKIFGKNKTMAKAPESIGIVMDNMHSLKRGQVICKPQFPDVDTKILARIFCVTEVSRTNGYVSFDENVVSATNRNFSNNLDKKGIMKFKCATQESRTQIIKINKIWDSATLEVKSIPLPEDHGHRPWVNGGSGRCPMRGVKVLDDCVHARGAPVTDALDKNDIAEVVVATETPVVIEKYERFNSLGRFVLENNDNEICAVGIVI